MTTVLECRDLSAGYIKQRPCLRGVDLDLHAGEITCLLGPNGAGKTTLLSTLSGLLPRAGGEIRVEGADIVSGRPRAAAPRRPGRRRPSAPTGSCRS